MLSPNDRARPAWDLLAEDFNRTHPAIHFRIIWSDITKKMALLSAADALPDLILLPDFQLVIYHDSLLDLGSAVDSWPGIKGEIYPSLLQACRYDGALKIVPMYYNVPFVFYRPDLFQKAGLPMPSANWTWEDYRRDARALTERAADGSVEIYGSNVQQIWWVEWLSLIRQAGGDLIDSDGRLKIGSPATASALGFMHDLIHRDLSAPGAVDAPSGGFLSGRYALYYGGHISELEGLKNFAPFPWDIAPLPAGPAGRATGDLAVVGVGVWKKTRHANAALEVVRYLAGPEVSAQLCRAGVVPARRDVARDVLLAGNNQRHFNVLVDSLDFAQSVPKLRFFGPLAQDCINPIVNRVLRSPDRNGIETAPGEMEESARNFLQTLGQKPSANPVFFVLQLVLLLAGIAALCAWLFRKGKAVAGESRLKWFFLFTAPWLAGLALFTVGPLLLSFWWAQTDYDLVHPARYVGWEQYRALLCDDPDFWHSLKLSLAYAAVAVPLGLGLALATALLLNLELPGIGVFRTLFYLPSILPVAASSLMWIWFLNPRYGLVNQALAFFHIPGPGWLQDPRWAMPSLAMISLWSFGGPMLIFLAGLKNIPASLYEAAEIDGAGLLSSFWHITLPSLAPVLFFNLTMGLIGALQIFDVAYIVSSLGGGDASVGGPEKSTYFYVLNLYEKSFVHLNVGVGSAMAWIFFAVVLIITAINFWARRFWFAEPSAD